MLFNDLTEDRQQRVIQEWRESSDVCLDFITDDFKEVLDILGYYDIETYFTGFWSQGDGASFEARYSYEKQAHNKIIDFAPLDTELHRVALELKQLQARARYDIGSTISTSSANYYHEMTMSCENNSYNGLITEDKAMESEADMLELHRDLARWYYTRLEQEYEYITSDEYIIESIVANDMEFEDEDN
jgi:hypothetical protein